MIAPELARLNPPLVESRPARPEAFRATHAQLALLPELLDLARSAALEAEIGTKPETYREYIAKMAWAIQSKLADAEEGRG